ncbi:MAG: hypothetical protein EOP54_22075, partial [Sphingobacteriales bacterium]
MITTALKTIQNNMEGSIVKVNGRTEVVLFNNSVAKYPPAITLASYNYTGTITATHSLCGLNPTKFYLITYIGTTVTVKQSATGVKPSPAGVLTFVLPAPTKAPQTLQFSATRGLVYGTADKSPAATSDNVTTPITYKSSNIAVATIVNGNLHIVGAGVTTITASQAGSVYFTAATDVMQTLTVTPAVLQISAPVKIKAYGTVNPVLQPTYSGFVNGDVAVTTPPVITTAATTASLPGVYPVTLSGAASNNYTFVYGAGKITVTKATLTITANNASKVQGTANPILTLTYSGFVNGDTEAVLTTLPTLVTTAKTASPVGDYAIVATGAAASNYAPLYISGKLTVTAPSALKTMALSSNVEDIETEVTIQQALSPNGDGINDALIISGLQNYRYNTVVIMNTSGILVYKTTGYDNNTK